MQELYDWVGDTFLWLVIGMVTTFIVLSTCVGVAIFFEKRRHKNDMKRHLRRYHEETSSID